MPRGKSKRTAPGRPPARYWYVAEWTPTDHWHVVFRSPVYAEMRADLNARRAHAERPYETVRMFQGRSGASHFVVRGCPTCFELMQLPGFPWSAPWPDAPAVCSCTLPIPADFLVLVDGRPMHPACAARIEQSNRE